MTQGWLSWTNNYLESIFPECLWSDITFHDNRPSILLCICDLKWIWWHTPSVILLAGKERGRNYRHIGRFTSPLLSCKWETISELLNHWLLPTVFFFFNQNIHVVLLQIQNHLWQILSFFSSQAEETRKMPTDTWRSWAHAFCSRFQAGNLHLSCRITCLWGSVKNASVH